MVLELRRDGFPLAPRLGQIGGKSAKLLLDVREDVPCRSHRPAARQAASARRRISCSTRSTSRWEASSGSAASARRCARTALHATRAGAPAPPSGRSARGWHPGSRESRRSPESRLRSRRSARPPRSAGPGCRRGGCRPCCGRHSASPPSGRGEYRSAPMPSEVARPPRLRSVICCTSSRSSPRIGSI